MKQAVERVQSKLLSPLSEDEAQTLTALLAKVVASHDV
jgi:hypothetical protein